MTRVERRRRFLIFTLILGVTVFALAAICLQIALRPTTLRIAAGPSDSGDEKLIKALAEAFINNGDPVRLETVTTTSSEQSLKLFANGNVDLAVARSDYKMPPDAEIVVILRRDFAVLWSHTSVEKGERKNDIESIRDLGGRAVAIANGTLENVGMLKTILAASGVNPESVTIKRYSRSEADQMTSDRSVDAFMTVEPANSEMTASALEHTIKLRGPPTFLPVEVSEAIERQHPTYRSEGIPGSMFNPSPAWPPKKLETLSVSHVIVARKSLSETAIASLTRQIISGRHTLSRDMPSAAQIRKPDTDKDAALAVHRGAAAYVDGTERTFLDRYSDYIWFALLGASGVASALAWLRKLLMRDEWEGLDALRRKVTRLTDRARNAGGVSELEPLGREAELLVNEAIDCYGDGVLDSDDVVAFNLLLQQFHQTVAIQERKLTVRI